MYKKDLQKKKNDDEIEEGWVQCDCCESWVHMICGLFNKGKNDKNVHYLCPNCLVTVRVDTRLVAARVCGEGQAEGRGVVCG